MGAPEEGGPDDDVDMLTAAALEESRLQEYWEKRGELLGRDAGDVAEQFYVHVRGGRYTLEHTGRPMDTVRASARAGVATEFVRTFGLQRTSSYSLRTYGDELGEALARCWAHKMQWVLAKWVEAGLPEPSAFDLAGAASSWEQPPWTAVVESSGHAQAQQRLSDIRRVGL